MDGFEKTFFAEAAKELERAERKHRELHSLHEACAIILEEWEELWAEAKVWKGNITDKRRERVFKECVQIAAMAARAVKDLL